MTDWNMPPGCTVAEMERVTIGDDMPAIPDSEALRRIRERDAAADEKWFNDENEAMPTSEAAFRDRRALLALIDDLVSQAHEGCFVKHDCPAMFACTYIVAQTSAPEESSEDDDER